MPQMTASTWRLAGPRLPPPLQVRDMLPTGDRIHLGILAGDEGEAGGCNLYGRAYGLPAAISGMNSNWLRGYGDPPPQTVIMVGMDHDFLEVQLCSLHVGCASQQPIRRDQRDHCASIRRSTYAALPGRDGRSSGTLSVLRIMFSPGLRRTPGEPVGIRLPVNRLRGGRLAMQWESGETKNGDRT